MYAAWSAIQAHDAGHGDDSVLQVRLMREAGFQLGNVDATIILQRPKLSPHKEAIIGNLCKILDAHPSVVNIKVGLLHYETFQSTVGLTTSASQPFILIRMQPRYVTVLCRSHQAHFRISRNMMPTC